ncbi:MAG: hypothetical protein ABIZ81_13995 [Opitutaceae bacterium]
MSAVRDSDIRRWALSGVIAIAGVGLVASLFGIPENEATPPPRTQSPPIVLRADDGVDAAFDEQKILADPTPLFLPTKWNAARKGVNRPEPGATFENYQPSFVASALEQGLKSKFPNPVTVPVTSVEALAADPPGPLFAGIGRGERVAPTLDPRSAVVKIVAAGTGQAVLQQIVLDARPPGDGAWQPMEFLGRVDAIGLVGTLAVTRQSGVEGVDDYFRGYLVQTLRIGQRLAPGVYRISIGP